MAALLGSLGFFAAAAVAQATPVAGPDTLAMAALARELSSDAMRGRGPLTPENSAVARRLADELTRLGARPVFGSSLLVPFLLAARPRDTVYNVIGLLPGRGNAVAGEVVGITAHFDHLGIGPPDAAGDSIYNGFLDAALPVAMVLDVARRQAASPAPLPLLVLLFNLEEQGLVGSRALLARSDAAPVVSRMRLLIGVDAGVPTGEALEWQLMGGAPEHVGSRLADSLARARGWSTTATPARPISDVYLFAQRGVAIVFPIPGAVWRDYSVEERAAAMAQFDHYHQPADQWRPDFPMIGAAHFADWLWDLVRTTAAMAPSDG